MDKTNKMKGGEFCSRLFQWAWDCGLEICVRSKDSVPPFYPPRENHVHIDFYNPKTKRRIQCEAEDWAALEKRIEGDYIRIFGQLVAPELPDDFRIETEYVKARNAPNMQQQFNKMYSQMQSLQPSMTGVVGQGLSQPQQHLQAQAQALGQSQQGANACNKCGRFWFNCTCP